MMGMDKELKELQKEMDKAGHTGFCMCDYDSKVCYDCPTEDECMRLYLKERRKYE